MVSAPWIREFVGATYWSPLFIRDHLKPGEIFKNICVLAQFRPPFFPPGGFVLAWSFNPGYHLWKVSPNVSLTGFVKSHATIAF